MKKYRFIFLFILSVVILQSCLVNDTAMTDDWGSGPNLAGFEEKSMTMGGIANGDVYDFEIPVKVFGPTHTNIKSDVTITVEADPASTAVEGTHYSIPNKTMTLNASNDLLGLLSIQLLSEGIDAPLAESPVLILKMSAATGAENLVPSGKKLVITLNYLCNSVLAGKYTANVTRHRDDGSIVVLDAYVDDIRETGTGEYRTSRVGHWGDIGGTPGYTFYDVCDVLTVPGQNLVDYYSNWVEGVEPGAHNKETGVLTIKYSITSTWWSIYDCVYTPVN